jgi:hypothetical protein
MEGEGDGVRDGVRRDLILLMRIGLRSCHVIVGGLFEARRCKISSSFIFFGPSQIPFSASVLLFSQQPACKP